MQMCYCIVVPLRFAFRFCVSFNGTLAAVVFKCFQVNNCSARRCRYGIYRRKTIKAKKDKNRRPASDCIGRLCFLQLGGTIDECVAHRVRVESGLVVKVILAAELSKQIAAIGDTRI